MNYNHLFYFWTVARLGSISRAATELQVSQPTISEQLRKLEETLGTRLFERIGRGLRLTQEGQNVYRYAEKIFQLGHELAEFLQGQRSIPAVRLAIGIAPSVPELLARRIIAPALKLKTRLHVTCMKEHTKALFAKLAVQDLDVVLSGSATVPAVGVRAYHHPVLRSGISFFAARSVRPKSRSLPANLDRVPFLMPATDTKLSHFLQSWFAENKVRPQVVAEFSDSALLYLLGEDAVGCFAAASIVEREIRHHYKVEVVGRTREIMTEVHAFTLEKKPKHPGILAMLGAETRDEET